MEDTVVKTRIGPGDHGRRMSLAEFAHATGQPGYLYELAHGVIEVMDLPGLPHARTVRAASRQLAAYEEAYPDVIELVGGGGEAGMQLYDLESERHPDISIYLTPPPDPRQPWDRWVPDIAIEVVSPSSRRRDYEDKREDYLAAGVREYWIIDLDRQVMLVLQRAGEIWRERELPADGVYHTPLLPGFSLQLGPVFAASGC